MTIVYNRYGFDIDFEFALRDMTDQEILDELKDRDLTEQQFFDAYCDAYKAKHGKPFFLATLKFVY